MNQIVLQLEQLDSVRLNYGNNGELVLSIVQAFIMFGVALGIKPLHFKTAFKYPKSVITGVVSQIVLLPLVTFLGVCCFRDYLTVTVALGAILVACCPGGNVSNFISSISRGNIELSVSLTAISTVSAVIVTPLNFSLWGNLFINSSGLVRELYIPISDVFKTLFFIIGLPLLLGVLCSAKFPRFTQIIAKPIQRISVAIFMAMVIIAFGANFIKIITYVKYIFVIVLIQNALAFLAGNTAARVMHLNDRDRRTLTIETGIQNSGLALMLIFNPAIFPPEITTGGMEFLAAWWGVWHIISGLGLSLFWNCRRKSLYDKTMAQRFCLHKNYI
ncbi:MAG: bile acid:sodium symporter family protein [Bacteroidales bacterium]|nr:bile acid:sodium symporter family protein [Bacteroidales bacterium]